MNNENCHTFSADAIVSAQSYGVRFGNLWALKDVNLKVHGSGIHAIIGPSGCGKSTFLMSVAGLLDVETPRSRWKFMTRLRSLSGGMGARIEGKLSVQPECMPHHTRRLKSLGIVFQDPLPFRLGIFENVALALQEHKLPPSEVSARAEQALKDAGLWLEVRDRLSAPADSLSGGQKQRLCLARTLALDPCLLLLDEPCSSLDPIASAAIEESIAELKKTRCILLVTHNLAQARRLADDVSLFWSDGNGGTCIESQRAEAFFTAPQSALGAMYLESEWGGQGPS